MKPVVAVVRSHVSVVVVIVVVVIVLVVVVHDPRGEDYYGGAVAAPVFSAVMKGALRLRNIRPAVEEQLWVVADEADLVEEVGLYGL